MEPERAALKRSCRSRCTSRHTGPQHRLSSRFPIEAPTRAGLCCLMKFGRVVALASPPIDQDRPRYSCSPPRFPSAPKAAVIESPRPRITSTCAGLRFHTDVAGSLGWATVGQASEEEVGAAADASGRARAKQANHKRGDMAGVLDSDLGGWMKDGAV